MFQLPITDEIHSGRWFIRKTYEISHHCVERTLVEFFHDWTVIMDVLNRRDELSNPARDMLDCSEPSH
jgi:hypothetical protein